MCKSVEGQLGEFGFCIDQTEPFKLAHAHLSDPRNCDKSRQYGKGYYSRIHGSLVELMMTRSFVWYVLTSSGVGLISADADVSFLQNPFSKVSSSGKPAAFVVFVTVCSKAHA